MKNNFKNKGFTRQQHGFTLIEMLIVASVFIVVFIFSLGGLRTNRRISEFRLSIDRVASEIRQAQTMALTGISDESVESIAYGIYFDESTPLQYLVFKDSNSDNNYDIADEIIETVILPQEISLDNVSPDTPTEITSLSIVFTPPKPTVYFNGETSLNQAQIDLTRASLADKQGNVTVNRITGRITAELNNL